MIKVEERKNPQHNLKTEKFLSPKKLYLSLRQHIGAPSKEIVKIKEKVEEAQVLAEPQARVSSYLSSPKKGEVVNIDYFNHPILGRDKMIVIRCDSEEKKYSERKDIAMIPKDELLRVIKEAGVVGMGGAGFPTYIKLQPPQKVDTLIINGCECEPYLAGDYRLMIENMEGIFKGIEIITKIIEPERIFFCVEDNKPEAIKKINSILALKKYNLASTQLVVLKSAYPQGGEKQLIYKVTKRKVPSGGLPLDVGCLVHNVATCFSIYEAVYFSKPLIERIVTFAGDALETPKNIWLKIGTLIPELFERGILKFKKEPKKVIFGGPMMGIALKNLDYPILKTTGGVLFLSDEVDFEEESRCLHCARCVDVCPMGLVPLEFVKYVKNKEYARLNEIFIKDCIECGMCSFACPAKIPIVHYIKIGKLYAVGSK